MNFLHVSGLSLSLCANLVSAEPERPTAIREALCIIYGIECHAISSKRFVPLPKRGSTAIGASDKTDQFFSNPENWSPQFFPEGVSDFVLGFEVQGDSILALGSIGLRADSTRAWGAALWDGSKWTSPLTRPPLTGQFSGVHRQGGTTTFAGSYPMHDSSGATKAVLASWDGKAWGMRDFPAGIITSFAAWEGKLLVASMFDKIQQVDETSIRDFTPRIGMGVAAIAAKSGQLWVRGILEPQGTCCDGFATLENGAWKYSGMTRAGIDWTWLGDTAFFLDNRSGGVLYPSLDSVAVVKWDKSTWNRIPLDPALGKPRRFASDGQSLFLIGVDRIVATNEQGARDEGLWIAKWDGSTFKVVERQKFNGWIFQATYDKGRLFLGGAFERIGDLRTDNLAMWDGEKWRAFSEHIRPGLPGSATAVLSWNNKLVFAGENITAAGLLPASGIAAWDESKWDTFGKGIRASERPALSPGEYPDLRAKVACLAGGNGMLFAGGEFDSAGNIPARNIARWDGREWSPLGVGLPFAVGNMVSLGSEVFAVRNQTGETFPPGSEATARWDGNAWHSMGDFAPGHIAEFKGSLWGTSDSTLAKWNGTGWGAVHSGIPSLHLLLEHKGFLYIAGGGGKLYKFNGESTFDSLPFVGFVSSLASDGESLYLMGRIDIPGHSAATLARWNGTEWLPLANLPFQQKGMAIHGDYLYVYMYQNAHINSVSDIYWRWNRLTGTWSRSVARKPGSAKASWRVFPCAGNCFLSQENAAREVFDLHGRKLAPRPEYGSRAAGVRVMKTTGGSGPGIKPKQ